MGLLAYFSIAITERMHSQTMTVFDLPMSLVYGGVAAGCFMMVIRQAITVWTHARQGWRKADDYSTRFSGLKAGRCPFLSSFSLRAAGRRSRVRRAAGSSLIYTTSSRAFRILSFAPDGGRARRFPAARRAVLHPRRQLMNSAGITNRIYDFAVASCGWMRGGLAHVNIFGSVIFAGMSGTAIADAAGLGTIEIKAMQDHGYDTSLP
jgi:hypothetical protein